MGTSTIALVVSDEAGLADALPLPHLPVGLPVRLIDAFIDSSEIQVLEMALLDSSPNTYMLARDAVARVYEHRLTRLQEEESFGDYLEDLLCNPFVHREIQTKGISWFKSKIKLEQNQEIEKKAVQVIAEYALKLFQNDSNKTDFLLTNNQSQVRVRVFKLSK